MNVPTHNFQERVACDPQTANLVSTHYETLKKIARSKRRRHGANESLLTTDILHESWLRLRNTGQWKDRTHFLRTCARAMRFVIIDHMRKQMSEKRGGKIPHTSDEIVLRSVPEFKESPERIVEIGNLLSKLGESNARYIEIVDLRYFGGFTEKETAEVLGVTERTVRRDWSFAKTWLAAQLSP